MSATRPQAAKEPRPARYAKLPFDKEVRKAVEASARALAKAVSRRVPASVAGADVGGFEQELEAKLVASLTEGAAILLSGKELHVSEDDPLLTTQQAADLLQVSRPHLVNLLDSGTIKAAPPAGNQRRVHRSAVLSYRRTSGRARAGNLRKLSRLAQKHDMGY